MSDDGEIHSFEEARKKWAAKLDTKKAGRQSRQKQLAKVVDRRSLRATGRTEQFNFRCRPGLKAEVQDAANGASLTLAEWMERTLETAARKGTDNA